MAREGGRKQRRGAARTAAQDRGPSARSPARFTATSREVAQLAGVSRTCTPDASVSELTRRTVMAAATKLGYQPNLIARSLITDRSRLVGLVMGEWENPFYSTVLRGFSEKLQRIGRSNGPPHPAWYVERASCRD